MSNDWEKHRTVNLLETSGYKWAIPYIVKHYKQDKNIVDIQSSIIAEVGRAPSVSLIGTFIKLLVIRGDIVPKPGTQHYFLYTRTHGRKE